jgi:hypothetical protein
MLSCLTNTEGEGEEFHVTAAQNVLYVCVMFCSCSSIMVYTVYVCVCISCVQQAQVLARVCMCDIHVRECARYTGLRVSRCI